MAGLVVHNPQLLVRQEYQLVDASLEPDFCLPQRKQVQVEIPFCLSFITFQIGIQRTGAVAAKQCSSVFPHIPALFFRPVLVFCQSQFQSFFLGQGIHQLEHPVDKGPQIHGGHPVLAGSRHFHFHRGHMPLVVIVIASGTGIILQKGRSTEPQGLGKGHRGSLLVNLGGHLRRRMRHLPLCQNAFLREDTHGLHRAFIIGDLAGCRPLGAKYPE